MLPFPVCHWSGGRGVDFGNLDQVSPFDDQNRLIHESRISGLGGSKQGHAAFRVKLKEEITITNGQIVYSFLNRGSITGGGGGVDSFGFSTINGVKGRISCSLSGDHDLTGGECVRIVSNDPYVEPDIWRSVLMSWDTGFNSGAGRLRLWIDDADELDVADSFTEDREVWYQGENQAVAAHSSSSGSAPFSWVRITHLRGCLEFFTLNVNTFVDFDVEANRRKFFTESGIPVDLGPTGSGPGFGQPLQYLTGPPGDWTTNRGSAPNMIHQGDGTLKVCT